jgi:hypothetical protein
MPYIDQNARQDIDIDMRNLYPDSAGELAYVLYKLCLRYVPTGTFLKFATLVGVFALVILEFWHREIVPYEVGKKYKNGDVHSD